MTNSGKRAPSKTGHLPTEGIILVDSSLNVIAADRAASVILDGSGPGNAVPRALPEVVMNVLLNRRPAEIMKAPIRVCGTDYIVTSYVLEPMNGRGPDWAHNAASKSVIALHLRKDALADDTLTDLAAAYKFTVREQEAFSGILTGLTTKELANRMNISPSTVKTFVRLVMIKMGVSTRAAIIARMLTDRGRN